MSPLVKKKKKKKKKKKDNLRKMSKLLKTYNLPKLSPEEAENLNRPITTNEI